MTVTASGGPPSPGGDLQRWLDSQRERTNNARHALKRRLLQLQQVDRRQWGSEIEPLTAAGASPAPELKPHPQPSSSVIVDLGVVNFGISESASFPTAGLPSRPWAGIAVPGLYLGAWLTGVAGTALIAAERPAMTWLTSLSFWVTVLAGMTWIGRVFANLPINRLPRWRNRTITPVHHLVARARAAWPSTRGENDEGQPERQEDLRQVQGDPPSRPGHGDLREPAPQAAPGLAPSGPGPRHN